MNPKRSDDSVLVVGAGPAGLEAARALAGRGYGVTLVEAGTTLGGRVITESALPGLSEWRRVADYRIQQLQKNATVEIYRESPLTAEQVLEYGFPHVLLATGSAWRKDGVGKSRTKALPGLDTMPVFSPDDLMAGNLPKGDVVLFDDDGFYMASVLAELLVKAGCRVHYVTSFSVVSSWSAYTLEQKRIHSRMLELGVELHLLKCPAKVSASAVTVACVYSGKQNEIPANSMVIVAGRLPNDGLYLELASDEARLKEANIKTLKGIGDAHAPGIIAAAVYSGHFAARTLEEPGDPYVYRRERLVMQD